MFKELTPSARKYTDAQYKSQEAWSTWMSGEISKEEYLRVNEVFLKARKEWVITDFGTDSYERMQKEDEMNAQEAARPWGIEREQLVDGLYALQCCGTLKKEANTYTVSLAPMGDQVIFDGTDPETENILTRMLPSLRRMNDKCVITGDTE